MPDLAKMLPDRVVRVPLSYLISAAVFLVSVSGAFANYRASQQTQSQELVQARQEITTFRQELTGLRLDMERLKQSLDDLKDSLDHKR